MENSNFENIAGISAFVTIAFIWTAIIFAKIYKVNPYSKRFWCGLFGVVCLMTSAPIWFYTNFAIRTKITIIILAISIGAGTIGTILLWGRRLQKYRKNGE